MKECDKRKNNISSKLHMIIPTQRIKENQLNGDECTDHIRREIFINVYSQKNSGKR